MLLFLLIVCFLINYNINMVIASRTKRKASYICILMDQSYQVKPTNIVGDSEGRRKTAEEMPSLRVPFSLCKCVPNPWHWRSRRTPTKFVGKLAFFQYSRLVEKIWVLAPFSRLMRPSDFVLFTLKHSLFLDFYAKVLLIRFKRRDFLNR